MPLIEVINCPVPLKTNRFHLKEGPNVLGRDKSCDIEIPDPRISSKHCIILVTGDKVEFIDQNSSNGIFVGDQRSRKGDWPIGGTLHMGSSELVLQSGNEPAPIATVGNATSSSQWGKKEMEDERGIGIRSMKFAQRAFRGMVKSISGKVWYSIY